MPTTAEHPAQVYSGVRYTMQSPSHSWTDDLPVCHDSAVGYSTNQIYREDGAMCNKHEFEDRSFHFRPDLNTCLYGVFDGHDGSLASHFAAQRLPAEVLLGQLADKHNDADIHSVLHDSFNAVEHGFFNSIDDKLAEIANLQIQLPEGIKYHDLYQQYPQVVSRLDSMNAEISGGTSAVVCLIHQEKIYIANVGNSRAVLVKRKQSTNQLECVQLSVDHNVQNEDELFRLSHLKLDVDKLRTCNVIGNQQNTRCIGNHQIKLRYKDYEYLSSAVGDPVIAEPEIIGGIHIDENCLFLMLMSDGLYKTYESATKSNNVNEDLAKLVLEQFSSQSTLAGVAQGAVDMIVRLHHDTYMRLCAPTSLHPQNLPIDFENFRDDITLMVRNFNLSLQTKSDRLSNTISLIDQLNNQVSTMSNEVSESSSNSNQATVDSESNVELSEINPDDETLDDSFNPSENLSSQSLSKDHSIDAEGKMKAYVDFTEFYEAVAEAEKEGKSVFNDAELVEGWISSDFSVILE